MNTKYVQRFGGTRNAIKIEPFESIHMAPYVHEVDVKLLAVV